MNNNGITEALTAFRNQIDDLDDELIALLLKRTAIVSQVGELKRSVSADMCPIRPGREAEQIRRIIGKFTGSALPPAAAAALWRIIIGTMVTLEGELSLSIYAAEKEQELFWLAREYFGPVMPVTKHPQVKRVIGDVMDGKAAVGIIPMLQSSDMTHWWINLVQPGTDMPKIFAHIPFVYPDVPARDSVAGLAIARLMPEPSGDDMSLFVLEADSNASQHRLQTAFATAKIEATWINIATLSPQTRHHLVELKGFFTLQDDSIRQLLTGLGSSILSATFLGAYATPVILKPGVKSNDSKPIAYAANHNK